MKPSLRWSVLQSWTSKSDGLVYEAHINESCVFCLPYESLVCIRFISHQSPLSQTNGFLVAWQWLCGTDQQSFLFFPALWERYLQFLWFARLIHHTTIKAYGFSAVDSTSGAVCMDGRPNSCDKSPTDTAGAIYFSLCCQAPGLDCNEDVQPCGDKLRALPAAPWIEQSLEMLKDCSASR